MHGYVLTRAAPMPSRGPGTHSATRSMWLMDTERPDYSLHINWKGLDSNTLLSLRRQDGP